MNPNCFSGHSGRSFGNETLSHIIGPRCIGRYHPGAYRETARHELIHDGTDLTDHFLESLTKHGFIPSTVGETHIQPGERVPAFYLERSTAYFGWVFWEKFSELRLRKLFGTVVRNTKGDWFIQLPSNSPAIIYINTSTIFEMDIDRPFEL